MSNIVQCSTLGQNGRWANSIIQLCYLLGYSRSIKATPEIPKDWIGRKIFDLSNISEITCKLPKTPVDKMPKDGQTNIDLYGYWQTQDCINLYSQRDVWNWLKWNPNVKDAVDEFEEKYCGDKYIACHVRNGDYKNLSHLYCNINPQSYINAVKKFGLDPSKINWVTEENSRSFKAFDDIGAGFLADFIYLSRATWLFRGNSTFSLVAGWMNGFGEVFSPQVGHLVGQQTVDFVRGNHSMLYNPSRFGTNHTELRLKGNLDGYFP